MISKQVVQCQNPTLRIFPAKKEFSEAGKAIKIETFR